MYQFADIINRYWPIMVYRYRRTCSLVSADIKIVFEGCKNAWTSSLKWCNHVVCPVEGSPLFNW